MVKCLWVVENCGELEFINFIVEEFCVIEKCFDVDVLIYLLYLVGDVVKKNLILWFLEDVMYRFEFGWGDVMNFEWFVVVLWVDEFIGFFLGIL